MKPTMIVQLGRYAAERVLKGCSYDKDIINELNQIDQLMIESDRSIHD